MKSSYLRIICFHFVINLSSIYANQLQAQDLSDLKVAFLADIHLQDVYADLQSAEFNGVLNPKNERFATIRTMNAQLNSTRLFNENYFALYAALNELVEKNIQLVVLPGDFTDDGQPMNVKKLHQILDEYRGEHDMRFFITTGNHDPVVAFSSSGGKSDFLGVDFDEQAISSEVIKKASLDNPPAISTEISLWGYAEIMDELMEFGFYPSEKDFFWSHPFEKLDYEAYRFAQAKENSSLSNRTFPISGGTFIPDASYVVEPVMGLWLLAIDGNVFAERPNSDRISGSSIGFNLAVDQKYHQLDWIRKVSAEAKRLGKTLISFSHYPLVDFNNGASQELSNLFGTNKMQLSRVPKLDVSRTYLDAGISVHFAGHMHSNDTGIFRDSLGATLVNVQVPSLAAFPPAYKVLTFPEKGRLRIQTQRLSNVSDMDEFFELYALEWNYRDSLSKENWNLEILKSSNYWDYTQAHLDELIRLRFLDADWPLELKNQLLGWNLQQFMCWATLPNSEKASQFLENQVISKEHQDLVLDRYELDEATWKKLADIDGSVMIHDFYRIKNGGELGITTENKKRLEWYSKAFIQIQNKTSDHEEIVEKQLAAFSLIFQKLLAGYPSDDFYIDLNTGEVSTF